MRRRTVISLLDVALFVQREVALYQARKRNPREPEKVIDPGWRAYDCQPFMEAIIRDVFLNTCEESPSEYLVQAKAILQNAGMNHQTAHYVCNRAFDMIVDYVSSHLPHLTLGDTSAEVYANMMGPWDVVVTEFAEETYRL